MIDTRLLFIGLFLLSNSHKVSGEEKNIDEIVITNAHYSYMPLIKLDSELLGRDRKTIAKLSVRSSKTNGVKKFTFYYKKIKIDIISYIRHIEEKFGYIDIGSIKLYEVTGEFCEGDYCIYRYVLEFGFLSAYNNYVHVLPVNYKFPWCRIELSESDVSEVECFEERQDGHIEQFTIERFR